MSSAPAASESRRRASGLIHELRARRSSSC